MSDALHARVQAYLREHIGSSTEVLECTPLTGGACQDLHSVVCRNSHDTQRMVLRSDAPTSLAGSLNRHNEFGVIRAARENGVQVPNVQCLVRGLVRQNAWSYFMDWADGTTIGRQVVRNPELEAARTALPKQLADNLARIHAITQATHPDLPVQGLGVSFTGDPVETALIALESAMTPVDDPHPAMALARDWLAKNQPSNREVTLVHGDYRTGNIMVDHSGLTGILDWEFAHWGSPMFDMAWICLRDWRFGRLDRPVGGFAQREEFHLAYEQASGRAVDREAVHWWEVWGNIRWAAGCVQQGLRYLSNNKKDIELIAIARRCAEMEYEALRLIQEGV